MYQILGERLSCVSFAKRVLQFEDEVDVLQTSFPDRLRFCCQLWGAGLAGLSSLANDEHTKGICKDFPRDASPDTSVRLASLLFVRETCRSF